MSKNNYFKLASLLALVIGCAKMQEQPKSPILSSTLNNPRLLSVSTANATIDLNYNNTYQSMQGFGTFGGRVIPLFESANRDTVLEKLFGENGLHLNIMRNEVLPTYNFDVVNSKVTLLPSNTSIETLPSSSIYQNLDDGKKEQLGQYWIVKKVQERYHLPMVVASAWTPPLYMKRDSVENAQGFNSLNYNLYSTSFARYLAGYAKAYQEQNIEFYAISPSNEPENIFSNWASCYWNPLHLGQFISNNLRYEFNSVGMNHIKIFSSENAAWSTAGSFLPFMDKSNVDIYAAHGYVDIGGLILGQRGLNQNPTPRIFPTGTKPIWVTEACDDGGIADATMDAGIKLSRNMYKLIANCNASAYIYWLGMLAIQNNESLVWTNSYGQLVYPKIYDVFGHYSRYIHEGDIRCATSGNSDSLFVTTFKNIASDSIKVVVTNASATAINCHFIVNGIQPISMTGYQTTDASNSHWSSVPTIAANVDKSFDILLPAKSISTLIGNK